MEEFTDEEKLLATIINPKIDSDKVIKIEPRIVR